MKRRGTWRTAALAGVILASGWLFGAGDEDFLIGSMRVGRGTSASGFLDVPAKDGLGTRIPFTVIHGLKPGKVLALVAGVHGSEYPPILALQRVRGMIDPKTLAGTVILVHIANLPSFQRRMIYWNPHDWKNLNRVFPGDAAGTLSQRMARLLTDEVVNKCDILIDMHCGDANEALIPYSYWIISGDAALDAKSKELALAFGLRHIIIDTGRTKDLRDSKYLGNTAVLMGKPAVTTESGYLGRSDEEDITRNVQGCLGVMRLHGLIPGRSASVPDPVWIDRYEVINANADGVWEPKVGRGETVAAGQTVGLLRDYFGGVLEEIKAPFAGIILYVVATPPANKGEPLYEVGRIKR
jgi:predicted deacylase